jgi:TetR/AcrR family transcriptional regulator
VLDAAEALFAERGFDRTRLEDVAAAVGIRRASIVYYFRDKRVLYDAVLEDLFGRFRERLENTLALSGALGDRIEAAISAWVDYVAERPTFARILLREAADGASSGRPSVLRHIRPFVDVVERFLEKSGVDGSTRSLGLSPAHIASTIAGATVFFIAALPALMPDATFDPLSADSLERHRGDVLRIARRLLGTDREQQ